MSFPEFWQNFIENSIFRVGAKQHYLWPKQCCFEAYKKNHVVLKLKLKNKKIMDRVLNLTWFPSPNVRLFDSLLGQALTGQSLIRTWKGSSCQSDWLFQSCLLLKHYYWQVKKLAFFSLSKYKTQLKYNYGAFMHKIWNFSINLLSIQIFL